MDGAAADADHVAKEVKQGLLADPKDLSPWPKYFYDAEGSRLFEEITRLPEYYQTRAELSIILQKAREIAGVTGCRELVELGSGSASKTQTLLDALLDSRTSRANQRKLRYLPLDVSESALKESGERLLGEYPDLELQAYVGDFDLSLEKLLANTRSGGGRLVIFLGGTIGNFTPEKRSAFLQRLRAGLDPGEHVLIGVDLVKDRETLEAAYDDAAGVTARFNKNLLKVFNYRLEADFDPELFEHRATYDESRQRIEMWLDSVEEQEVNIPALGLAARFERSEGMRTEISAKFTPQSTERMFAEADLSLIDFYTDDHNLFGLALGAAR